MGKFTTARLKYGTADCSVCGWKADETKGAGKNAMGLAAQHAKATGHAATAVLEYVVKPNRPSSPTDAG